MEKNKGVAKHEKKEFPVEKLQEIAKLEGIPVTGITILGGRPYINVTGLDRKVDNKCEKEKVIHVGTEAVRIVEPVKENGYLCGYHAKIRFFDRDSYGAALKASKATAMDVLKELKDTFTQEFEGEGWASPDTCEGVGWKYRWTTEGGRSKKIPVKMLIENIIMMAERRATNRAKREATGTGLTSLDEMPLEKVEVAANHYDINDAEVVQETAPSGSEPLSVNPQKPENDKIKIHMVDATHDATIYLTKTATLPEELKGRLFNNSVKAYVTTQEFTDWAKKHGLLNMKDVKDFLCVHFNREDVGAIQVAEVMEWRDYISNKDKPEWEEGLKIDTGQGQDQRRPGDSQVKHGAPTQAELLDNSD